MNHPISYMSEPGFWTLSDTEALGLRTYLLKGGFIIFDDFRSNDWCNLEEQMKRVIPDGRFVQIDVTHPIFHSFFDIKDLHFLTSYNGLPTYWAMFEDNDPAKRIIAIANRDNDLGEYLGVLGYRRRPDRFLERSVQVWCELLDLRPD